MAERFTVETDERLTAVPIDRQVRAAIPDGVSGTCTVFVRHTTAGVVVNEDESRLLGDVESFLAEVVPDEGWDHDRIDDNADSHLRALLLGPGVTVPVEDGDPLLGTWQSFLLVECDGPRTREVAVAVTPGFED